MPEPADAYGRRLRATPGQLTAATRGIAVPDPSWLMDGPGGPFTLCAGEVQTPEGIERCAERVDWGPEVTAWFLPRGWSLVYGRYRDGDNTNGPGYDVVGVRKDPHTGRFARCPACTERSRAEARAAWEAKR